MQDRGRLAFLELQERGPRRDKYSTCRNLHATLLQSPASLSDQKVVGIRRCVGWMLGQHGRTLGPASANRYGVLQLICRNLQDRSSPPMGPGRSNVSLVCMALNASVSANCNAGEGRFPSAVSPPQVPGSNAPPRDVHAFYPQIPRS
jgi:hypothetical protein